MKFSHFLVVAFGAFAIAQEPSSTSGELSSSSTSSTSVSAVTPVARSTPFDQLAFWLDIAQVLPEEWVSLNLKCHSSLLMAAKITHGIH